MIGEADNPAYDFSFTERSDRLVVSTRNSVELWDLAQRRQIRRWAEGDGPWSTVAGSTGRNVVVAGNAKGQIIAWELDTLAELARWESPDSIPWENLVFTPGGQHFAAAAWDRLSEAWIFELDKPTKQWQVPARQSKCAAFTPDGNGLAVAWMDDGLLYEWKTRTRRCDYLGHSSTLSSLTFSPDGRFLATVGHDRKLRLWDAQSGNERYAIVAHRDWVRSVAFAPDGWSLATGGDDGIVRLWHVQTGQLLLELPKESRGVRKVQYSPDGRRVACRTASDRIVVYDSKSARAEDRTDIGRRPGRAIETTP
jgi:WD40 repeat protein